MLTRIFSGTFAGLSSLASLWVLVLKTFFLSSDPLFDVTHRSLSQNQVVTIEAGAFAGLVNLTILYVSFNQLMESCIDIYVNWIQARVIQYPHIY